MQEAISRLEIIGMTRLMKKGREGERAVVPTHTTLTYRGRPDIPAVQAYLFAEGDAFLYVLNYDVVIIECNTVERGSRLHGKRKFDEFDDKGDSNTSGILLFYTSKEAQQRWKTYEIDVDEQYIEASNCLQPSRIQAKPQQTYQGQTYATYYNNVGDSDAMDEDIADPGQ